MIFSSTLRRKRTDTPFSLASSEKGGPAPNLNHRCSSSRRANCKRRDSRSQNRLAPTNCSVRYCCTQQYSTTALTDSSATIKERYAYDAYGGLSIFDASGTARTSTAEGNRYTYTGREWDEELGLYHYRARLYDAITGRFCSRDPIGIWDGPNLYCAYFVPLGMDPTGNAWVKTPKGCWTSGGNRLGLIVKQSLKFGPQGCDPKVFAKCKAECGDSFKGCIHVADIKLEQQGIGNRGTRTIEYWDHYYCCCNKKCGDLNKRRKRWESGRRKFRILWGTLHPGGGWPVDPKTGQNWPGHHVKPLYACGDPESITNVIPVPPDIHTKLHGKNGYPACEAGKAPYNAPGPPRGPWDPWK